MSNLSPNDVLYAILDAWQDDQLPGRTYIQKVAYFVQETKKIPLGFSPHYYGPYSPDIAAALSMAVSSGTVDEDIKSTPDSEKQRKYRYRLTEEGKRAIEIHRQWNQYLFDQAVEIARQIRKENLDYEQISYAAKVHFIKSHKPEADPSAITQLGSYLGWQLDDKKVSEGLTYLQKILNSTPEGFPANR